VKCDRCENEATVHEVRIESGKHRERHLCEHCARSQGVAVPPVPAPITELLSKFMMHQGEAASAPVGLGATGAAGSATVCQSCSTTYAQFRQTGLLGCPACYAHFENQLGPLLARAHEGGTHHVGKSPRFSSQAGAAAERQGPGAAQRVAPPAPPPPAAPRPSADPQQVARAVAERVALLKKRLAEAVAAEQYEKAAKIRDELARLDQAVQPQPETPKLAAKRKPRSHGDRPGGHAAGDGGGGA